LFFSVSRSLPSSTPFPYTTLFRSATDRVWVRAVADGAVVFEGFVNAGDRQAWEATRQITVRVGNAGAVDVSVNGRSVGRLGAPGDRKSKGLNSSHGSISYAVFGLN